MSFGLSLWVARKVSWGWMPESEADRWVITAAFATVVAGAVGAATAWWAGRDDVLPPAGDGTWQRANGSGRARITQVGRNQNAPGPAAARGGSGPVVQEAEASGDAEIFQIGGDQNPPRQPS